MKKLVLLATWAVILLCITKTSTAQYVVNFEGAGETDGGYAASTVSLSGINWSIGPEAMIGEAANDWKNGDRSLRLRGRNGGLTSMTANKSNGIGTISFSYRRYGSDGSQQPWAVEYSTNNGSSWTQVGSNITGTGTVQTFNETVNVTGNVRIRFRLTTTPGTGGDRRLNVDDITITDFIAGVPILSTSGPALNGFNYEEDSGPSAVQSFTVSASNLTPAVGNITVTAPTNYQVSNNNSTWASSFNMAYSGGGSTIANNTVYVRLSDALGQNAYSGDVTVAGGGASDVTVAVSGGVYSPGLVVSALNTNYTINFDAALANVNSASFNASAPLAAFGNQAGQLNNGAWSIQPNGNASYLTSQSAAHLGDFSGVTPRGTTTTTFGGNGIYAVEVTPGNRSLGFQPTGSFMAGDAGSITLRVRNSTGSTVETLNLDYDLNILNDAPRSNFYELYYSTNNTAYTHVPSVQYTSPGAADGSPAWVVNGQSTALTALGLSPGQYIYLRWACRDNSGSGNRDKFSIDNIVLSMAESAVPDISVTGIPFSDALCTSVSIASVNSNFTLSGTDFTSATGNVTVTAPTGFEVSTNAVTGFASSINIGYTGSALASTTVYVRIPASATVGSHTGNLTVSCATCGTAAQDFPLTGYVTQLTYPTPHDLSATDYTFTAWAATSLAGTYPAGMVLHMGTDPSDGAFDPTAVGTMNYDVVYNLGSRSRVNGLGADGLGFLATGSGQFNNGSSGECNVENRYATSAIVSLNTTDRQSVNVSWTAGTVSVSDNNRVFTFQLQYRLGQSGAFTNVTGGAYTSSTAGHSQAFNNIALPAACDDQAEVQVRWVYYQTGGSGGSRPQIRLDDITITGSPLACTVPDPVTALTATPSDGQVLLNWTNGACFDEMLVVARAGSAVLFTPFGNGSNYTPDAEFGSGFNVGMSQFSVFNANGSSVTVTGLINGTSYHFAVYTRRGSSWTAAVTASATPFEPAYYWNGGNTAANPANGGSGTWGTANAWRQPTATGAQATWANGSRAVLGGTGGSINLTANYTAVETRVLVSGYTLVTSNGTGRTLGSPILLSNNISLTIAPNSGNAAAGTIGLESVSGTGTASLNIANNITSASACRVNLTGTSPEVSVPMTISGAGTGVTGLVSVTSGAVVSGNITNSAATARTMIGATSGNTLAVNGVISGNNGIQFSAGADGGAGLITLNSPNTYTGPSVINFSTTGVLRLGVDNALPTGTALEFGIGSNNHGAVDLNGRSQTLASIAKTGTGNTNGIVNTGGAASLIISGSTATTYSAVIGQPANTTNLSTWNNNISLTRSGTGVTLLSGANTYTGSTTITGGTLLLDGSLAAGSAVSVNGGTLAGSGTAAGTVNVAANSYLSPGGTVNGGSTTANLNTGALTLGANSRIVIDINNAGGTAGAASGWDKVTSTGAVSITATSGSPVEIVLHGRTAANNPGTVPNFNNGVSYDWVIASGTSVSGYVANRFTVNATGFEDNNNLSGGSFEVAQVGNDLVLRFVSTASSTVYTRGSGSSESAAIWSLTPTGTGQTITALGGFSTNRSWVIQSGHEVELGASNTPVENITIQSGGRLWRNSNVTGNLRYVNLFGNLMNNGAIGNGANNDAIGFNIEGDNCEFSGSGAFDILRIRKSDLANVVSNLTINANVNLRWGGSGLYNNRNNSDLNVTIAAGRLVDVIGSNGTDGDVAMDGISGTAGERGGVITVNGTMRVSRKIFAISDNSVRQCGWVVGPSGLIETRDMDAEQHAFNSFTIQAGGQVRVTGTMAVKAGSINSNGGIVIQSGGQLLHGAGTAGGGGDVTGNITVRRQGTSDNMVYNYWSSPVASGVLPGGNGHWYDAAQGSLAQDNSSGGDNGWQPFSGAMTTGRGYASTGGGLAAFTGAANNGSPSIAVTASPGSPFNLIGNPYPSAMNASSFVSGANSGVIAGVLYFWSNSSTATENYGTNDYAVWSNIGSVTTGPGANGITPNGSIPVAQGFMVEALSNGTVQFTNAMRGGINTQFFKLEEESHMDRIWLNLHGEGNYNQVLVAFLDDATEERDVMYDAYKVRGNAHIALGAVQQGEDFIIAAFPSLTAERVVPLLTHVSQQGTYTFKADSLDGFQDFIVYLEDLSTGQLHPLQQGGSVTLQVGPQDEYGRFQLRFSPELVTGISEGGVHDGRIICIGTELQVFLSDGMNVDGEMRLVDALGRTVMHSGVSVTDGRSSLLDVSGFSTGVYFAEFRSGSVSARGRFILR